MNEQTVAPLVSSAKPSVLFETSTEAAAASADLPQKTTSQSTEPPEATSPVEVAAPSPPAEETRIKPDGPTSSGLLSGNSPVNGSDPNLMDQRPEWLFPVTVRPEVFTTITSRIQSTTTTQASTEPSFQHTGMRNNFIKLLKLINRPLFSDNCSLSNDRKYDERNC